MNAIQLVRLDYRLIHGQVITKWNNKIHATEIIIIDDDLTKDEFMMDIYSMAAPPGIKVGILTEDQFIQREKERGLSSGSILVLMKKVATLKSLCTKGLNFPEVQIGGLGGGKGRRQIVTGVTINEEEFLDLKEISSQGIKIYFQVTPEESKFDFEKLK